jgi:heptosyltransferase I
VRILIVKTSSMGDVVHAMPVVNDIHRAHPGAHIEWLAETAFTSIPSMHPGVQRVLPLAWRKWRGQLFSGDTWAAMKALREDMRSARYDVVLDLQGLVKSALWARQAGAPVAGYDRASIREPLACWVYQHQVAVPRDQQAVARCRQLAAAHLGYAAPTSAPDFGLQAPAPSWVPNGKITGQAMRDEGRSYSVIIPNASRPEKLWPERHWVAVGKAMLERGTTPVVLWGREAEQTLAERIAAGCEGDVPPFLKVGDMAAVLAGAQQVVGLDTGFTHLAAALGRPTVGIYCDHSPGLAGITGGGPGFAPVASIGGKGQVPGRDEVLALMRAQYAVKA